MSSEPYNSDSDAGDGWGTPPWLVRPIAAAIGGFDLDAASGAEPEPYAEEQYTEEDDGLAQPWYGDVWLNPPYGRWENPRWAEKVTGEIDREAVDSITALVPASTDTSWFQEHYFEADILAFLDARITFVGDGEHNATFPNVIALFGDHPPEVYDAIREFERPDQRPVETTIVRPIPEVIR